MIRSRLLRLVLATPLHATVSRRFLLLRAVDDRPVDPSVALRYATHQDNNIVLGKQDATWWRALSAEPTAVTVRFTDQVVRTTAKLVSGEELDESVLRYLQKYPGEWRELGVDAAADPEAMQAAARGVAVILFAAGAGTTT